VAAGKVSVAYMNIYTTKELKLKFNSLAKWQDLTAPIKVKIVIYPN
jgi:hypothetical protein